MRKTQEKMKAFYEKKKQSDKPSDPAQIPTQDRPKAVDVLKLPYPGLEKELDRAVPHWRELSETGLCYLYHTAIKELNHEVYEPLGKLLGFYTFKSKRLRS